MKIAICDDEAICLERVCSIANEYSMHRKDKQIIFSSFSHPEDLMESAEKIGGYDIYILDIVMPHINGIQLGTKLRDAGYDGKIIYLTSSEEYALDSFKVRAFDYIIKPIQKDTFSKTVDEAIASISVTKDKNILVKTKTVALKLNYEKILYVELSKRVLVFHMKDGKTVESIQIRTTFAEAVAELNADRRFAQCGASLLVNLNRIEAIDNETVSFDDTSKMHLSKKNCRELRGIWTSYLFEEDRL